MAYLRGLILIILVSSCGAYKHRILTKYCKQDTITVSSIVVTPQLQVDTVFSDTIFTHLHDTLTITKDKLIIKYFRNTQDGTVYLGGKVKADTVFVQVKAPCNQIIKPKTRWEKTKQGLTDFFAGIGILAILIMFFFLLFKK